jgi:hypothetical protein
MKQREWPGNFQNIPPENKYLNTINSLGFLMKKRMKKIRDKSKKTKV